MIPLMAHHKAAQGFSGNNTSLVDHLTLAVINGLTSLEELALNNQFTGRGAHEADRHIHRDHALRIRMRTARSRSHRKIEQSHAEAAMPHLKAIQMLWPQIKANPRLTVLSEFRDYANEIQKRDG